MKEREREGDRERMKGGIWRNCANCEELERNSGARENKYEIEVEIENERESACKLFVRKIRGYIYTFLFVASTKQLL